MNFLRLNPCRNHAHWGLRIKLASGHRQLIPRRGLIQSSEEGHVFQNPLIRMTPKLIRIARITKRIGWTEEPPVFITRKEFLGMMTVMRVKVNMVALVFFLCLVYHIIQKGRELRKKGHNLDDCSQDQVIMLRLSHLMEQKEKRDKIDAAALASKS
ncbi:uncharacterized protein LOC111102385 [Crassostrea virginica]